MSVAAEQLRQLARARLYDARVAVSVARRSERLGTRAAFLTKAAKARKLAAMYFANSRDPRHVGVPALEIAA